MDTFKSGNMKTIPKTLKLASTLFATTLSLDAEIRDGWFLAGTNPKHYHASVLEPVPQNQRSPVCLKSIGRMPGGFGTLMHTFKADAFRGKRLRLSTYLRSDSVQGCAGLWMRVAGPRNEPLAFDNMEDRSINGTTRWANYDVVLDVPSSAKGITVGLFLAGAGRIWLDDLHLNTVKKSVPATGATRGTSCSMKRRTGQPFRRQ
jgi:hypothetical protein